MSTTTNPRRILHLDDDPDIVAVVAAALQSQNWQTDHAASAQAALAAARDQRFDAMIIDRTLPEGDGLDVLRQMRSEGITTPAIVLSALGDVDNRVQGLTSGADDYLPKPFAMPELLARLTNLLQRRPAQAEPRLKAGPLELDLESHLLYRGDRQEVLLPRETRLLAYLMRHPDVPLTRAMLLRDVWNFNLTSETNVIDVHMGKLRKKVDFPDESPLIRTLKGVGFMFAVSCPP